MSATAEPLRITEGAEPIPGYILRERIGAGGYGEVWRADAPGELSKAVKFIYGGLEDRRASRELKSLRRMKEVRHPFLLSLERIEVVDGHVVIVTELAEESLKDQFQRCRDKGLPGISRSELLAHLGDVADALDFLHERHGLQHLDVKPENLLLVGGRVKVADFGLLKDLAEQQGSLMGGLTPLYAPPEVFDGRPSSHSDQYSLAIVFQELLTGSPPFGGRTAAQLAAQHLQSPPMLDPLQPLDQPVVARALSKDPSARFPNCREFVDHLLTVSSLRSRASSVQPSAAGASDEETRPSRGGDSETTDYAPTPQRSERNASVSQTMHLPAGFPLSATSGEQAGSGKPVESLGLIEPAETTLRLRPNLFIGIGGTAAHVLRALRRRLLDRYGTLDGAAAIQFLLLDTDPTSLRDASNDRESSFPQRDTFATPLKQAKDYRNASQSLLEWLSRRWLYNIPRSLRTEGIRPLGRLALVDNAPRVLDRLRSMIAEATSSDALCESAQTLGLEPAERIEPRVWIVAATSGGTGSGMVLDFGYVVRHLLQQAGFNEHEIVGVLTHATDRRPSNRDLAIANSLACLRELKHYAARAGGFPGAQELRIGNIARGVPPFDATYFAHLGDRLADEQYQQAAASVAEYLYLSSLSPAENYLSASRRHTRDSGSAADSSLRTFRLSQVGGESTRLSSGAIDRVCRALVQRWRGTTGARQEDRTVTLADPSKLIEAREAARASTTERVQRAARAFVETLPLELNSLIAHVYTVIEQHLQRGAEDYIAALASESLSKLNLDGDPESLTAEITRTLEMFDAVVGGDTKEDADSQELFESLEQTVADQLREPAHGWRSSVHDWLWEYADTADLRTKDALYAGDWFQNRLRETSSESAEMTKQLRKELVTLREQIHAWAGSEGNRKSSSNRAASLQEAFVRYLRLRIYMISQRAALGVVRIVESGVRSASDGLRDLNKRLSQLADQFYAAHETGKRPPQNPGEPHGTVDLEATLRDREEELAQRVDASLCAQLGPLEERLRRLAAEPVQNADALTQTVRAAARQVILRVARSATAAAVALEHRDPKRFGKRWSKLFEQAQPPLVEACGGRRRLFVVLPEAVNVDPVLEELRALAADEPNIVPDPDGDVVVCYEAEGMPLRGIAVSLMGGRRDFAKIAARLLTRTDIQWTEI